MNTKDNTTLFNNTECTVWYSINREFNTGYQLMYIPEVQSGFARQINPSSGKWTKWEESASLPQYIEKVIKTGIPINKEVDIVSREEFNEWVNWESIK